MGIERASGLLEEQGTDCLADSWLNSSAEHDRSPPTHLHLEFTPPTPHAHHGLQTITLATPPTAV